MANVSSSNGLEKYPKLRFKGFSEPWTQVLLSDVFKKSTKKNSDGSITNVICNSAKNGLIPQREYFDKNIANSENTDGYYIIEQGDFVYNPRKSIDAPYGPVSIYKYPESGIVSPLYLCFRALNTINSSFYDYFFKSPSWHRYIYLSGDSGARHDRVSIKDDVFFAMPVNIPSEEEQNRIASFLTLIEERIAQQQALVERLKKYKRGAINSFFDKEDVSMKSYFLGEIGTVIRGLSYDKFDVVSDISATVVLRSNNIQGGFLDYNNDLQFVSKTPSNDQLLQRGDIVICMANGSASLVGKAACFDGNDSRILTVGAFCGIYRCEKEIIEYFFQSDKYTYALRKMQQGGDGAIGNLKPSNIESLQVSLPNEELQNNAVKFFKLLDRKIYDAEKILAYLTKLKSGLLHSLFV